MATASTNGIGTPNHQSVRLQPIIVIGAGVLGLSSALTIQDRHPDNQIVIIAAETPSLPATWSTSSVISSPDAEDNDGQQNKRPSADYASMWAGAHYRPIPRSTRQLEEESDLALTTNAIMSKIASDSDVSECGVATVPAVELLERPSSVEIGMKTGDVYAGPSDDFRILSKEELLQYDNNVRTSDTTSVSASVRNDNQIAAWGCAYNSYCINVHVYCQWLLRKFVSRGGKIARRELASFNQVFDIVDSILGVADTPLVVNCSGRNFDNDPAVKIIRGQTVLVRNEYHRTITRQNADGSWAFLIPRPGGGGTIVGGTKEVGDTDTQARPESRKRLLENSIKYFPDFVDKVDQFDVMMDNVGRRPWREGGLRIEVEHAAANRRIIHGYGAGGRGYEISWGVAEKVADLVDGELSSV